MSVHEPDLESVARSAKQLLAEQEVAALATLSDTGYPAASHMHIAADGFTVYLHTFVHSRKYGEMRRDPRVAYVVSHVPDGGFAERRLVRSLQVKGLAAMVTDPEELSRAVEVSREQFGWLRESRLYDNLRVPAEQPRQAFFRVDPVEAVWTDHRVRQMWRTALTFTADGRRLAGMRPYADIVPAPV